ncbi:Metallo-dependent hydrolase [Patellaria atrata CBS 101060]|uniref:Metallo-dependent hydrolase n=1 Tax=Patellaria atrata CBS 101060 TaxID=1346257 RepID=A0A9P4S209_9PEZI|nr:Metallo-dependent hydrolase [Patellaria atrata CBS 101060]
MTESSSILFENGTVISYDDSSSSLKVLPKASLLVTGDRIASIFPASEKPSLPENTETVDCTARIISPGFVNTHNHGWQTAFKTLGANTTLAQYIFRYGEYASFGSLDAEDVYVGHLLGMYESLNAGVTTIVDHAHHTWDKETTLAGLDASIDSGARVYWCDAFHNLEGGWSFQEQLDYWEELTKHARLRGSATEVGIGYDSFGMGSEEEVKKVVELAKAHNAIVTTHHLGGPLVIDNGPAVLHKAGILDSSCPVILSHASFFANPDEEIALLRKHNQHTSITPESECHYGHDHALSHTYLDQCSVGVDTHFTFSADLVTQTRLFLQTTRRGEYRKALDRGEMPRTQPFDVEQAFILATKKGGDAVRRADVGVLKEGAKADVVVFEGESPGMLGWRDAVAAVLLHSNVGDVRDVLVDGRWRKRGGRLVDPVAGGRTYEELRETFLRTKGRIQDLWIGRELPKLEGKFFGGSDYGDTETVRVVKK